MKKSWQPLLAIVLMILENATNWTTLKNASLINLAENGHLLLIGVDTKMKRVSAMFTNL